MAWVSKFCWKGAGSYHTFIFLGLASLLLLHLVVVAFLFTAVALCHFANGDGWAWRGNIWG